MSNSSAREGFSRRAASSKRRGHWEANQARPAASRADVRRYLLADARIAARITEILGGRLAALEQRLSDSVFKSVPQRIATTLVALSTERRRPQIA